MVYRRAILGAACAVAAADAFAPALGLAGLAPLLRFSCLLPCASRTETHTCRELLYIYAIASVDSVAALDDMTPTPRHAESGFQHVRNQDRRHPSDTAAALRRCVAACSCHAAQHRQAWRCDGPCAQGSVGLCQGPRVRHAWRQHRRNRFNQLVPRGGQEVRVRAGHAIPLPFRPRAHPRLRRSIAQILSILQPGAR